MCGMKDIEGRGIFPNVSKKNIKVAKFKANHAWVSDNFLV